MFSLLSVLACKEDPPTKTGDDDDDVTGTSALTGETGGFDCQDGLWLPGGYWDLQSSIEVEPESAIVARDLTIDPAGNPIALVVHHTPTGEPESLSVRSRVGDEGPLTDSVSYAGTTLETRTLHPDGRSMGYAPDGVLWIGGALSDEAGQIPFVVPLESGVFGTAILLDVLTPSGTVTAGPVFTEEGAFWLGTRRDSTSQLSELVLWRVDLQGAHEVYKSTELQSTDTAGQMIAGALSVTADGRVLFGGGVQPSAPGTGRAMLSLYDGSVTELLALTAAETGNIDGSITDAVVGPADALTWVWGANTPTREAQSWLVFEGPLTGPQSSVQIDIVTSPEISKPYDLVVHPSGVPLVGGSLSRDTDESLSPVVRMEQTGGFFMTFFAPSLNAGYINALEVAPDGQVWALCLFGDDGLADHEITILRLTCFL